MPAMSCDRNGAAMTSSSSPVPAWNSARMWATGKPQPLAWLPGWPKWACSAGVSGMENDEPSTRKVRWPQPEADRLGGGDQALDHLAEDGPEDGQRERGTGLAEGGRGEGAAGQQRDVGQGGVAVEDLDEEPVDDGRRGQEAAISTRCVRRRGRRRG